MHVCIQRNTFPATTLKSVLTGADQCGGRLADVVVVSVAFGGEGGDVVQHAGRQASHDMGGLMPVQEV